MILCDIDFCFCFFAEDEPISLKNHLIEELDYMLLPDEAWTKLMAWYGIVDNQVKLLFGSVDCINDHA